MHVNLTTLFQRIAKFTENTSVMLASLTKAQKKVARTLIDLALERECAKLIRKVSKLSSKSLDDVEKPNHARYLELFKAVDSFDRRLQNRYDGITGGHYLETISYLYAEGSLKEDDLEICDEEMKSELIRFKSVCDSIQSCPD